MIRFKIINGDNDPVFTEWAEELLRSGVAHTAVEQMTELRKIHGRTAAISIERTTIIPEPDRTQVRFKIDEGEDKVRYSIPFPMAEKEQRLVEMKEKYPDATITEDLING